MRADARVHLAMAGEMILTRCGLTRKPVTRTGRLAAVTCGKCLRFANLDVVKRQERRAV